MNKERLTVIIILLFASVSLAVEPVWESQAIDTGATTRSTATVDEDFATVAAYAPRLRNHVAVSTYNLVREFAYEPYDIDRSRGFVLCTVANNDELYTTVDNGQNFVKVLDTADEPFATLASELSASIELFSVKVLDNGDWLASVGKSTIYVDPGQGGIPNSRLYKSTDGGTTWASVLDMKYGYTQPYSWAGVDGPYIVLGEYGHKDPTPNARQIYVSSDYGDTWTLAISPDVVTGQHCHTVAWDPTTDHTAFYASYGDLPAVRHVSRYVYNGDSWALDQEISSQTQPTNFCAYNGKLYLASDNATSAAIIELDPATNLLDNVLHLNEIEASGPQGYDIQDNTGTLFMLERVGDIFVAAVQDETPTAANIIAGVYVSPDMLNWAPLIRGPAQGDSYVYIAGELNGLLFVTGSGANRGKAITMPSVKLLQGQYVNSAMENLATTNYNDSFETTGHNWTSTDSVTIVGRSTEESLHGDYSLKVSYNIGTNYGGATGPKFEDHLGHTLGIGEFVTVNMWIKPDPDTLEEISEINLVAKRYSVTIGVEFDPTLIYKKTAVTDGWYRLSWSAEILQTFDGGADDIAIQVFFEGDATQTNYLYIDCVEYFIDGTRLPNYDLTTFGTQVAEVGLVNMLGAGPAWTLTGRWCPMLGNASVLSGTLPIIRIEDEDGGYLDFYWKQSDTKFYITDGTSPLASTETYAPLPYDDVKFAIVADSTGVLMRIEDPINGEILIGNGTGTPMAKPPVLARLGVDNAGTSGHGTLAQIRVYDSKLSQADIQTSWDTVGHAKQSYATYRHSRARTRYSGTSIYDYKVQE